MDCEHTPPHSPSRIPLSQASKAADDGDDILYQSPHLQQVTMAEYEQQARELTSQAVQELKASPEYKRHTQQCSR